jgi:uncharacterized protein YlzI (FlbEa/FlbD family)
MQFCCPKCKKEEEIIGDSVPLCLKCHVPMVKASGYAGLWMSPRFVIARMERTMGTRGIQLVTTHGRFKKEREAWTSGMFALGLAKLTGNEYWVEIETVEQTPDTRIRHIDQSSGHNVVRTQSCEIVDWEEHVQDILQVIRQKCQRAYPPYFCLLVLARNGTRVDFEIVIQEVKKMRMPFAELWILGRLSIADMAMLRIIPDVLRVDFNILEAIEKTRDQQEFLTPGKRGTSTEFRDLGMAYLPVP